MDDSGNGCQIRWLRVIPKDRQGAIYIGFLAYNTQFSDIALENMVLHLIIVATNCIRPNIIGNNNVLYANTAIQMSGYSQLVNTGVIDSMSLVFV